LSPREEKTRTKIVATLGPQSSDETILRALMRAGMDVARINFSHGTHEEHAAVIRRVRTVAVEEGATVAVLADLQGPKLRIGALKDPLRLVSGDWMALTTQPADGAYGVVPLPHPELILGAAVGDRVLFGDGEIEAVVREVRPETLILQAVVGGTIRSHLGAAFPGGARRLDTPLTEKDRTDARFAVAQGVDFVALSFVRSGADIRMLRQLLDDEGAEEVGVIAKIEKREALECLEEILEASDAIMIARGDLGIELPPQEVPSQQKRIIRLCNQRAVPVITATQMLQAMVDHPRPTRAEASDVANAILDGTDAVMLSAETAVGRYPEAAVAMMREIAAIAEADMPPHLGDSLDAPNAARPVTDAIGSAVVHLAETLDVRLIVASTWTGYTARQIARLRPHRSIVGLTPNETVLRQMALVWGVTPLLGPAYRGTDEMLDVVSKGLIAAGLVHDGDRIVVSAGIPVGGGGKTNLIKVHTVGA
jgi:pyruvate kinase